MSLNQVWWYMPVIPALRRLRQEESQVQGQPGLHSKTRLKKQNKHQKSKKVIPLGYLTS
jgi:hypothetical protein